MNKNTKLFSVISYITWIGFLAAFFLSEKDDIMVRHHLNQALVINLIETVGTVVSRLGGIFGLIGTIIDIAVLVFFVMGISRAAKLSDQPLPYIGDIHLID